MPINGFKHSFGPPIIRLSLVLLVVLILTNSGFAKMYEKPKSFALQVKSLEQVQRKVLPRVDVKALLAEDRIRLQRLDRPQPLRFAFALDQSYTLGNSGTTTEVEGGRLWHLRIRSEGAKSHNLGITRFEMPDGAKLWIYDPAHTHVEGPYTARHRSHRGSLWTPIIEGDEIVVEVFMPANVSTPVIEITKVNQGYRGFEKAGILGGNAGDCNVDVMCPAGNNWSAQMRAIGAYTIEGKDICTGTMLNNTRGDRTPYFLSANHCGVNAGNDDTVVVYWNYQKLNPTTCTPNQFSHGPGSTSDNQTGSLWLAAHVNSDFALLRLSSSPDLSFNVFYAGWDTTATPASPIAGIHHPWLEVKAISMSSTSPSATNYLSSTSNSMGSHWRVDWNSGVTERGSSGSCLFAANGRCIGQLHGGNPLGCQNQNTQNNRDWYGRFSASWVGGGTNDTRLSNWLDPPPGTGVVGIDGDPHITTTNNVHYDFQAAGEFVSLRDPDGLEIQTRQTPIATTWTPPDAHSGLSVCVSINTAVAARVGKHRVSYQPDQGSGPDPGRLQLRIDGKPYKLEPTGLNLDDGGRLAKTVATGGLEIDFPDGSVLFVTPNWWANKSHWYFNINLTRPLAVDGVEGGNFPVGGIAGAIEPGDWLPKLPDGSSMGPIPDPLHERFVDLYQKFADAWRVTNESSLFDYEPGTSTDTFTLRNWPPENPPCQIPQVQSGGGKPPKPPKPVSQGAAEKACLALTAKHALRNCIFDVRVTGNLGFAETYRRSQYALTTSTRTTLTSHQASVGTKESTGLTATVALARADGKDIPTGSVQFMVDGRKVGKPVRLDANGQARLVATSVRIGKHKVSATYIPDQKKKFSPSLSALTEHNVDRN